MGIYPESLLDIIKAAAQKFPSNIDAAVNEATSEWRQAEERGEWLDTMERSQIRTMIHEHRHAVNTTIRREAGEFGGPAKVGLSTGAANRVAVGVLDMFVAGRVLGNLLGKELATLAKDENESAAGHARNARLLSELAAIVPEDKRVRDVVSEAKVKQIWQLAARGKRKKQAVA